VSAARIGILTQDAARPNHGVDAGLLIATMITRTGHGTHQRRAPDKA